MACLEYSSDITGRQVRTYGSIHHCNRCSYATKSIFFMVNHARRHKLQPEEFNCEKSDLEVFYDKECHFKTSHASLFNHHIRLRHLKNDKKETNLPLQFLLKSYTCDTCSFQTLSSLIWLKHTVGTCIQKNKGQVKHVYVFDKASCDKELAKRKNKNHVNVGIMKQTLLIKDLNVSKKFKCDECHYSSKFKADLMRHKLTHLPWSKCKKCPYKTRSPDLFKLHLKTHLSWSRCKKCPYKTKNPDFFKLHLKTHLPELFKCPHCNVTTKYQHLLNTHIIYKHNKSDGIEKWLHCEQCPYKTLYKGSMEIHRKKHPEIKKPKWFRCPHCVYKTTRDDLFDNHVRFKHPKVPRKSETQKYPTFTNERGTCFKCPHCDFKSKRQLPLDAHLVHKHLDRIQTETKNPPLENQPFKCPQCIFKTTRQDFLNRHLVKVHIKSENKVVPSFKSDLQEASLKKEIKVNHRKMFKCGKCNFQAISNDALLKHVTSEHTMFKCGCCPYTTRGKLDLKIHTKFKHTTMFPQRCDICHRHFSSNANVVRHMRESHKKKDDIEWFSCKKCPFKVKRAYLLLHHLKTVKH